MPGDDFLRADMEGRFPRRHAVYDVVLGAVSEGMRSDVGAAAVPGDQPPAAAEADGSAISVI